MPIKIFLSPSQQYDNVGVGNYGTEKQRMKELSTVLNVKLKNKGFEVKEAIDGSSLAMCVNQSNLFDPDLHLCLHSDACDNKDIRGCTVYCFDKNLPSYNIACKIYSNLSTITPVNDRGVKTADFYELHYTDKEAVLIEVSFHSNMDDAKWIIYHVNDIADSIVNALCSYYGVKNIKDVYQIAAEKGIIKSPEYWRLKGDEDVNVKKLFDKIVTLV